MNDKLSHQLYKTIYPVVVKLDTGGLYNVWAKFVEECAVAKISIKDGTYSISDNIVGFVDYELRLKYDGAFYDNEIRFKTESAVTMFLLRFS